MKLTNYWFNSTILSYLFSLSWTWFTSEHSISVAYWFITIETSSKQQFSIECITVVPGTKSMSFLQSDKITLITGNQVIQIARPTWDEVFLVNFVVYHRSLSTAESMSPPYWRLKQCGEWNSFTWNRTLVNWFRWIKQTLFTTQIQRWHLKQNYHKKFYTSLRWSAEWNRTQIAKFFVLTQELITQLMMTIIIQ